nr:hypothetical protein [Tanacetum cinerariifolium]
QGLRIGEEERMHEEEEADELYRDVDINLGRGLQVSQETEDSHMILTPTQVKSLEDNFSNIPGGEHASASTPSEPATKSARRSTTGSQSRQLSASESGIVEEPVQTTCQMKEPTHPVFETGAEDQPII